MTYILGTTKIANKELLKDEDGCELCDKIVYLGNYIIMSF